MVKTTYKCTQQELYAVARLGWNSATAYLDQFTAFKPKYVSTFITDRLSEIDAAEAQPDSDQRSEDSKTLRVTLTSNAADCLGNWQKLKRYIIEAYPQSQQQIKLDAAGQAYYRKAAQDDWNAVKSLLNDGNTFITTNITDLTANENMPPSFATTFSTAKTDFEGTLQDFFTAGMNDEVETQTKITMNNDVHAKLMSMFLDGKEIFRGNDAMKKLFTFEQVLLTVSGPGVAGLRGLIKDGSTNQPIGSGIGVSLLNTDYTTTTNVNSRYTLSPVAAASYTVIVTKAGYQTLQVPSVEIQTGTIKNLEPLLVLRRDTSCT